MRTGLGGGRLLGPWKIRDRAMNRGKGQQNMVRAGLFGSREGIWTTKTEGESVIKM